MVSNVYKEAITETLDILKHMKKEDVIKISPKFIEFLNDNALTNYTSDLDHTKKIKDMDLKYETKAILAIIYMKFWCNKQQLNEFENKITQNELFYQAKLREKYNPDNIFKNEREEIQDIQIDKEKTAIIQYKKNIFTKIINRVKLIFKK